MMRIEFILIFAFFAIAYCNGAKILGVYFHPGKSHHKLGEVLFKELAKKGHQVTMVSTYPLKTPFKNYRDIDIAETSKDMKDRIADNWFQKFSDNSASVNTFQMLLNMTTKQTELLFTNKEFRTLIESGEKFDVVIIDWLFNESHLIFSKIFNCPMILSASAGLGNNVNYVVGNPGPYAYVPYKYFPLTDQMNFWERLLNTALHIGVEYYEYHHTKEQQNIINRQVPQHATQIKDLLPSVALILSNGHYTYETRRPVVPNIIEVGGYHIEPTKQLPEDIRIFLDGAKDGFIYFSLGTNMQSIFLDADKKQGILNAFSKLKIKVLWKFEGTIDNLPKNVKISKWLPQNDVLAHSNIKIFITHGGLLSTIESVYHGVPMIGIPMFGDQNSNVPAAVEAGYALRIKPHEVSEEKVSASITEILNNPSYTIKAKLYSDLLKNQPMRPMDRAIYWIEHVIKHKGADHLKNGSMRLTWYQNLLLDVTAFILAILGLILGAFYLITKFICKRFCRLLCKKSSKTSKNKKNR